MVSKTKANQIWLCGDVMSSTTYLRLVEPQTTTIEPLFVPVLKRMVLHGLEVCILSVRCSCYNVISDLIERRLVMTVYTSPL